MMLKKSVVKGKTYYTIVESKRVNGQPRHITLKHIGTAKKLFELLLKEDQQTLDALNIQGVKDHGDTGVLFHVAKMLDLPEIINNHIYKGGGLDVGKVTTLLAINRCIEPSSKNQMADWYRQTTLDEYIGIPDDKVTSQNLCSTLDYFYQNGDSTIISIQKDILGRLKELFNISPEAIYYDLTSTYFEGSKCRLAKFGYNRDGLRDKLQINIGLLVTKEHCFPLTHLVFEGNIADISTVKTMIHQITDGFVQKDTLMVFDRGMVSKDNLEEFDAAELQFITALKKTKEVKALLDNLHWDQNAGAENRVELMNSGTVYYLQHAILPLYGKERSLVFCYNPACAEDLKKVRDGKIRTVELELTQYQEKLQKGNHSKVNTVHAHIVKIVKRAKSFFQFRVLEDCEKVTFSFEKIDQKIANAEKYDGKTVLIASQTNLSPKEIVTAYFEKDAIEKAFACLKGPLELRPIRHWNEKRVKSHVFVCYLSFLLMKTFSYLLKSHGISLSPEKALKSLNRLKSVSFSSPDGSTKREFVTPNDLQKEMMEIVKMDYLNP